MSSPEASKDIEDDLLEISKLMRMRIEIRNRSWMKRVHKSCFIGSDAVTWIVDQGFANTRADAVAMCRKMVSRKFIRHTTDAQPFRDDRSYYRFTVDEAPETAISGFAAGNGNSVHYGQGAYSALGQHTCVCECRTGGCKWSIAPHTAYNSYILTIAMSEELERAVAGASVEARRRAVHKLREAVRNEASPDAPHWDIVKTQMVQPMRCCLVCVCVPSPVDIAGERHPGKCIPPREAARFVLQHESNWEISYIAEGFHFVDARFLTA
jgi:hypothetical protein